MKNILIIVAVVVLAGIGWFYLKGGKTPTGQDVFTGSLAAARKLGVPTKCTEDRCSATPVKSTSSSATTACTLGVKTARVPNSVPTRPRVLYLTSPNPASCPTRPPIRATTLLLTLTTAVCPQSSPTPCSSLRPTLLSPTLAP